MIPWYWLIVAFIGGSIVMAFLIGILRGGATNSMEETGEEQRWYQDQRP